MLRAMRGTRAGAVVIYGANGYTGDLVAREARARGLEIVVAGRNEAAVAALGRELGAPHRAFSLDDPAAVAAGLAGTRAVVHCAGPFAHTWRAMVEGCLRARVHYLDVTGEVAVFEALAARGAAAETAGVVLLPGAGFDVVPSDCLAAHLARRLPGAEHLTLAFASSGGLSRGTLTTMTENAHRGGLVRRRGVLTPVPAGWRTRAIDFGRGPRLAVTIPWGDVSTAFHSTGIPNIEVYAAAPPRTVWTLRASRLLAPVLALPSVRRALVARVRRGPAGPSAERRERSTSVLWGEVRDAEGRTATARLFAPDGYTLTARTAVAAARRVVDDPPRPGFQTPSRAFGPDFVLEIEGVRREDL